jgi:hypothetical protein
MAISGVMSPIMLDGLGGIAKETVKFGSIIDLIATAFFVGGYFSWCITTIIPQMKFIV